MFSFMNFILTTYRYITSTTARTGTTSEKFWEDCGVKWMGVNFETMFMSLDLKVETTDTTVPNIPEVGESVVTSVLHFSQFLKDNRASKKCFVHLLYGNDGNLWRVYSRMSGGLGGWHVGARSTGTPDTWGAGDIVGGCLGIS